MTKELEALEKVYYGSQGYGNCDENYKIVKQALHRLEAIDNANPSEALINLKYLKNLTKVKDVLNVPCWNESYEIVKQALLKAQEPKKYLKWEDLEFKELEFKVEQKKDFKVKLNDTEYGLEICITFGIKEALIFDEKKVLYAVFHERHKQFFNDLHLERVEE